MFFSYLFYNILNINTKQKIHSDKEISPLYFGHGEYK